MITRVQTKVPCESFFTGLDMFPDFFDIKSDGLDIPRHFEKYKKF